MAVTRVDINSNDGDLLLRGTSQANVAAGTGTFTVETATTNNRYGWWFPGGTNGFAAYQSYFEYSVPALPAGKAVAGAAFGIQPNFPEDRNQDHELYTYDWGGSITSADWRTPAQVSALTQLANYVNMGRFSVSGGSWWKSSDALRNLVAGSSATTARMLATTSQYRSNTKPGNNNAFTFQFSSETANGKPWLRIDTITKSTLNYNMNAQVQLSTGENVFLTSNGTSTLSLQIRNLAGTTTTIETYTLGGGSTDFATFKTNMVTANQYTVLVDASDNIFVVGKNGALPNGLTAKGYVKGSGLTWTAKAPRQISLPDFDAPVNNVALTYHAQGTGYAVAVVSHADGYTPTNDLVSVSLSLSALLGSGTGVLSPTSTAVHPVRNSGTASYTTNPTGSMLDIEALTPGTGVYATLDMDANTNATSLGSAGQMPATYVTTWSYTVSSTGALSTAAQYGTFISNSNVNGVGNNSDAKLRLIAIDATRFAVIALGHVYYYAGNQQYYQDRSWTNKGGATIPTDALASSNSAWDALYDPSRNKIWIYYTDSTSGAPNSRRIMRTGFSLDTQDMTGEEIQIATNTGASGSSTAALRVAQSNTDERYTYIQVGNVTGALALSTVLLTDNLNVAPNTPVINDIASFDASAPKLITWIFGDANPKDSQSAYQLVIRRNSDNAIVYDSGKTAGTLPQHTLPASSLANDLIHTASLTVWDEQDTPSSAGTKGFSTSSGSSVTITNPATDNAAGINTSYYTISWTYNTGGTATQSQRQIKVYRTDTGALLFNTGMQATTAQTYQLTNLLTGVEQRIEVSVIDTNGITSTSGTRLITPDFTDPDIPTIVSASSDYAVTITVTNPTPTGSRPFPSTNLVFRRAEGETDWVEIGSTTNNSTYTDYTGASGVNYFYYVQAVA